VLDPVISGNRPTRNYAYLVFDRTVRFRLKRPFPHLPAALAGPGGNVPAIMPERLAKESPFKPVAEIIGSGPTAS
jgi:ABC-type transport system substrate-binding protein